MSKRVFIALSGGVDSSVSAYLLKMAGYDVTAIHLRLYPKIKEDAKKTVTELEQTCRLLNIPLQFLNLENDFSTAVIQPFCRDYSRGRTPNPCVQCNRTIKFGLLLEKIQNFGGDYLATGHYARIEKTRDSYLLKKGVDISKDQSYFLHMLGQRDLSKVLFPVGGMQKSEVKKIAAELGLPAFNKRESQDVCFIPEGKVGTFLNSRLRAEPGDVVDIEGRIVGQHRGLILYTIGQRHGLRVAAPQPLYVLKMDLDTNRLVIGPESCLYQSSLIAGHVSWVSGTPHGNGLPVTARVRYRGIDAKSVLQLEKEKVRVRFTEPQKAIAPGQSVVFYEGELVLGGGIIE